MRTSENTADIYAAFVKFQLEVEQPKKNAVNPFFKSSYTTLDEILKTIKPALGKYGLAVIQEVAGDGINVVVTTRVIHESGEWIEAEPLVMKSEKNTPQGQGSAASYARRYAISAILGIASEDDDDGNSAEPKNKGSQNNRTQPRPPAKTDKDKIDALLKLIESKDKDLKVILDHYKVSKIEDLNVIQWKKAMDQLQSIPVEEGVK